jgi:hypothetical protein
MPPVYYYYDETPGRLSFIIVWPPAELSTLCEEVFVTPFAQLALRFARLVTNIFRQFAARV